MFLLGATMSNAFLSHDLPNIVISAVLVLIDGLEGVRNELPLGRVTKLRVIGIQGL